MNLNNIHVKWKNTTNVLDNSLEHFNEFTNCCRSGAVIPAIFVKGFILKSWIMYKLYHISEKNMR